MNATLDFLETIIKGHWVADACGIDSLDSTIIMPPGLLKAAPDVQRGFVEQIARKVVDRMTLVDSAYEECGLNTADAVYNYARVLCHFGSLCLEFRDAWAEGDGDRAIRCWKMFLPHFKSAGRHKYAVEALRLLFQVDVVLSPNLAHQVRWHRFINTKGGPGRNIPCDLHNEHMNKLIKDIIGNMGSNLTETSLQYAVRSVSTLETICKKFDRESQVLYGTSAHFTRPDDVDVRKVVSVLLSEKILVPSDGRKHRSFPEIHFNPLHKWDIKKTKEWIKMKKLEYLKNRNKFKVHDDDNDKDNTEEQA